jgi:hemerythrin-like domain-containing protein
MDAIDLLIADHNRVKGLFVRYNEAQDSKRVEDAAFLAGQICEEVEVHTTIEEEIFYPAAHDQSEKLGKMVDEGIQEHHVVKVLMDEVNGLEPGSQQWIAKMTVIIESVDHHVEEEEEEMFPSLLAVTDGRWRDNLGAQLESKKAELGAPTFAEKARMTKAELLELAKIQKIPGRSEMDHDELAATVRLD